MIVLADCCVGPGQAWLVRASPASRGIGVHAIPQEMRRRACCYVPPDTSIRHGALNTLQSHIFTESQGIFAEMATFCAATGPCIAHGSR